MDDCGLGCQLDAKGPQHELQHNADANEYQIWQGDPGFAMSDKPGRE
jgi:hypothetical protein